MIRYKYANVNRIAYKHNVIAQLITIWCSHMELDFNAMVKRPNGLIKNTVNLWGNPLIQIPFRYELKHTNCNLHIRWAFWVAVMARKIKVTSTVQPLQSAIILLIQRLSFSWNSKCCSVFKSLRIMSLGRLITKCISDSILSNKHPGRQWRVLPVLVRLCANITIIYNTGVKPGLARHNNLCDPWKQITCQLLWLHR